MPAQRLRGLYGIADHGFRPALSLDDKVRAFLDGGASAIQLRMKGCTAKELLEATRRALALSQGKTLILVNDRPDVALAAGADGVHVGEEDLPVSEIRRFAPRPFLIGATVRTVAEARRAVEQGADYLGVGPIYATGTKQVAAEVLGLARLSDIVRSVNVPVVAIAGITVERAFEVAQTGAAAAAVISDVLGAEDRLSRAKRFDEEFRRGAMR